MGKNLIEVIINPVAQASALLMAPGAGRCFVVEAEVYMDHCCIFTSRLAMENAPRLDQSMVPCSSLLEESVQKKISIVAHACDADVKYSWEKID